VPADQIEVMICMPIVTFASACHHAHMLPMLRTILLGLLVGLVLGMIALAFGLPWPIATVIGVDFTIIWLIVDDATRHHP